MKRLPFKWPAKKETMNSANGLLREGLRKDEGPANYTFKRFTKPNEKRRKKNNLNVCLTKNFFFIRNLTSNQEI